MEIDKLKDKLTNVGLNYGFFKFNVTKSHVKQFPFVMHKIRSYKNFKASNFYKSISRSISLKNYPGYDSEGN